MIAAPPWRVLYVEDDRVAALLFVEALRESTDFEVDVAETGAEALQVASQWQPHVLVLDAHLPDTNGVELLARLRALPGLLSVPAFFCSADALLAKDLAASGSKVAGCWLKPVQRTQMVAELTAVTQRPRPE